MGAATVTPLGVRRENRSTTGGEGLLTTYFVSLTPSASYGASGETCNVSAGLPSKCWGGKKISRTVIGDHKYEFELVPGMTGSPTTLRLRAIDRTSGLEVAAGVNLSGETVSFALIGR